MSRVFLIIRLGIEIALVWCEEAGLEGGLFVLAHGHWINADTNLIKILLAVLK